MENNFSSTLLKIYEEISIYLMLLLRGEHRILFMVFEVIFSFKWLFVCGEEDKLQRGFAPRNTMDYSDRLFI